MPTPKDQFFDLHVHPSLKGGMSTDKVKYNAWNAIEIFEGRVIAIKILLFLIALTPCLLYKQASFHGINPSIAIYGLLAIIISVIKNISWEIWIKYFPPGFWVKLAIKIWFLPTYKVRQLINSQASLTQISTHHHVAVVALIAMEKAYAHSLVYRAIGVISPLDASIMRKLRKNQVTYLELLLNDLYHLEHAANFKIAQKFHDVTPDGLNVILSVEGAHSFQGSDYSTIPANFSQFKNKYRLHHLTLAHLTQQPASVHCLGVRLKAGNFDTIKVSAFRPDSTKIGISNLGKTIIELAYEDPNRLVLIDIKHMSYVSRLQFYEMRKMNSNWNKIPLIVSHAGVTGTSFKEAKITKIREGRKETDCDEVFWFQPERVSKTLFNPWTINLFDEDIIKIIESFGIIGIIMDERVLGYGKLVGEYMSKEEVKFLDLKNKIIGKENQESLVDFDISGLIASMNLNNASSSGSMKVGALTPVKSVDELLFDTNYFENLRQKQKMKKDKVTHIHYLACNIIHILKVGYKHGFDGSENKPDVTKCICIGSDLDGIIDAINFKGKRKSVPINQNKWVTSDKYDQLKVVLAEILKECLEKDEYMRSLNINVANFINKLFHDNGYKFLEKNFK